MRGVGGYAGITLITGDERTSCLEFVASDFGRLARFAEANAAFIELRGASGAPPRSPLAPRE